MQGKKTSFGPLSLFTIINNVCNWLHENDVLVHLDGKVGRTSAPSESVLSSNYVNFCLVFHHLIKSFKVICCTNI